MRINIITCLKLEGPCNDLRMLKGSIPFTIYYKRLFYILKYTRGIGQVGSSIKLTFCFKNCTSLINASEQRGRKPTERRHTKNS